MADNVFPTSLQQVDRALFIHVRNLLWLFSTVTDIALSGGSHCDMILIRLHPTAPIPSAYDQTTAWIPRQI